MNPRGRQQGAESIGAKKDDFDDEFLFVVQRGRDGEKGAAGYL